jgi:acetyl esterase
VPIDKQTQALLDRMNAPDTPALCELTVADARAALKKMTLLMDVPENEVYIREERTIEVDGGEIPVRIFWPDPADAGNKPPLLILYHGGGFILGDLETHENVARFYCKNTGVIVVNVDYRLAPEHKFPAGVEDCYAALCWTAAHADELGGDPQRLAVTGDSAGGNLSAVVCQLARQRGGPAIRYQVLVYPCVTMDVAADYDSRKLYGNGDYFLSLKDMEWIDGLYFNAPRKERKDLRASPILTDDLSGLPQALIITAGHDPLRDEGHDYARKLKDAGVPVEYKCYETTIHGFFSFAGAIDAGKDALTFVSSRMRSVLYR